MADTIKETRTIEYVNPNIRDWNPPDGKTMYFAECVFEDGSNGSILAFSRAKAEEAQEALRQIKDSAIEMELEKGKVFNNVQNWRIKGFDGMPSMGSGGGGGGKGGGGMSHAQAGLMAAAAIMGPVAAKDKAFSAAATAAETTELADIFTDWLFTRRGGQTSEQPAGETSEGSGTTAPDTPAPAPPAGDAIRLDQRIKIKELSRKQGLDTDEKLDEAIGKPWGTLTADEADTIIQAWSA